LHIFLQVSQDRTWSEAHVEVMKDAVQIGFKRNANFTETHRETLISFKKQSCSSNCNDKGPCTEEGCHILVSIKILFEIFLIKSVIIEKIP
jgi:hypothetical protein